jgi:phage repressor protein C with HTH and peptisase S24 domain
MARPSPDAVRRRLVALVEANPAHTLQSLSLALGRNHAYLHQYVVTGSPRELRESDRRTLAILLDCSETELRAGDDDLFASRASAIPGAPVRSTPMVTGTRNLPILGHAKGGEDAFFIDNGEIAGYTMRPHILDGVNDAYAVEFWDTSMEPALKHGHLGWVHPRKPVKPGDDVVVQLNDGQALVKTLLRRTDTHVVLRQYNPPKDFKIERGAIKSIHLIVGTLRVVT